MATSDAGAATFGSPSETKPVASDGLPLDNFGASIAVSGSTIVVGSPRDADPTLGAQTGSAYVFDAITGTERFKLTADDAGFTDQFSFSVGVSGTTAIVGSLLDDDNGGNSGSAYVFDTTTGNQIAKLTPNDGATEDRFGTAVAVSGATAIVGSPFEDDTFPNNGAAYLFDTTTGTQLFKLTVPDALPGDQSGNAVAISGNRAIVGARSDDNSGLDWGAAYVFDTETGELLLFLFAEDGEDDDQFGFSVGISGTTAIVGAPRDQNNGRFSGSAYLFDIERGTQIAKLTAPDGAASDFFGASVAVSGTTAVVGSLFDDGTGGNSGSVYLFDAETGDQITKITASDSAAGQQFGSSVAISGSTLVAGSREESARGLESGSAYVFQGTPAPIPLPASIWLLGSTLGILMLRRRA